MALVLASGIRFIDVWYRGQPGVVGTGVIELADGVLLVDPGPGVTLPRLEAGLREAGVTMSDVRGILLTHIHLDHAGATGAIVRENPSVRVFVHERGAPHMIDPTRLLESARRLYGDRMDELWGPFLPVPAGQLTVLDGTETLRFGARVIEVAYTPGHASHHVSYFEPDSRIAFVGDVGGARLQGFDLVMAPTPPPDVHLEAWSASIARILRWSPVTLVLTHYGPADHPEVHLRALEDALERQSRRVRALLDEPGTDEERVERFSRDIMREIRQAASDREAERFAVVVPADHCYHGLARYWRKKLAAA